MLKLLARSLFVLACVAVPRCLEAESVPSSDTLTIFVQAQSDLQLSASTAMRAEVARLLEPSGLHVDWRLMSERKNGEDFQRLVRVDLKGVCSATPLMQGIAEKKELASTAIVDGRILPFSTVDCDRLRRFMAPAFTSSRSDRWPELFGRAIGRVVAHEIFHMVAQTRHHSGGGASKAGFRVSDLTADRFEFDEFTLAQLRISSPSVTTDGFVEESDPVSGR